jgi:hypothetical protein
VLTLMLVDGEQDKIGARLQTLADSVTGVYGFADYGQIGFRVDKHAHTSPEDR